MDGAAVNGLGFSFEVRGLLGKHTELVVCKFVNALGAL